MSSSRKLSLWAGIFGNSLEWYDYGLYASLSSYISAVFFPSYDPKTAIMLSLATFAVGFIARPIGAFLFSHIGDKYGRKIAMIYSIMLMAVSTFAFGLLPSYDSIGTYATFFLIFLRIIQGMSVGGEFSISAVYLMESAQKKNQYLYGSMPMLSIAIGMGIGATVTFIMQNFCSHEEMLSWGWRIPFLLSAILSLAGWFLRSKIEESQAFTEIQKSKKILQNPIKTLVCNFKKTLIIAIILAISDGVSFYVICFYSKVLLERQFNFSPEVANLLNFYTLASYGIFTVISGWLSDKLGAKKILLSSMAGIGVCTIPTFWAISRYPNYITALLAIVFLGGLVGLYLGSLLTFMANLFPVKVRSGGLSLSYNIALILFGGTAPMASEYILSTTNNVLLIGMYVAFFALISMTTLWLFVGDKFNQNYE